MLADPVLYGVMLGLLLGKPLGIMLMSFIIVKSKLASLPENVNWFHMLGASILGGVGFTMPSSWRTSRSPTRCTSPRRSWPSWRRR